MLQEVDIARRKVITVEDPIEYELTGTVQLEVNPRFDITFARAVRAMLRQDPDVILVGEIRDPETATAALEASLTGHLVLTTVHATDGPSVARRLIDLGAPRFLLEESLEAIVSQRLLRRLCTSCRQPVAEETPEWFPEDLAGAELFVEGRGCRGCAGLGFRGRLAVFEVIRSDLDITRRLLEGQEVSDACRAGGTLRGRALAAVRSGQTSPSEVERVLGPVLIGEACSA